jgi:hypothetical protein
MKTESYNNPRPARSTSSLLVSLAISSAILAAIIALTGCGIPVAIAVQVRAQASVTLQKVA